MKASTIRLRSINSLLTDEDDQPTHFRIPAYQRGYRWSKLQVTQLLEDLWEFVQTSESGDKEAFYCLQPLVIKVRHGGKYDVVDGQQRLITIYILLTYLKDLVAILGKARFQISFVTKNEVNEPFLQDIDLDRAEENVDFFHICEAYKAIDSWFSNRDAMHKLKLLQHLLNDDVAGRNVKVIWFELAENDDPVAAFTRLNVGKIPLTNDELIRALFLKQGDENDLDNAALQNKIASEWDQFEKTFQSEAVWNFLSNKGGKGQNRIGFLFELVARKQKLLEGAEHDAYGVFYAFNKELKKRADIREQIWRQIKQTFLLLDEWYEDRILYHIIGFLVTEGFSILKLLELSEGRTKSEFERELRREVFVKAMGSEPSKDMNTGDIRIEVESRLESLEYGRSKHREKISSLLLLFNIATLLQNPRSNMRFRFDSFKKERWNIEHIRSVASDKPERHPDQKEWLEHVRSFLESDPDVDELRAEIEAFMELPQGEALEAFEPLYGKVLLFFREEMGDEADHGIDNLVLLDESTNKSYKNAVFAVKRQRVLRLDQDGIFVPLCTRNVFLKAYSPQAPNLMFWSPDDREAYQGKIINTLVDFFCDSTGETI